MNAKQNGTFDEVKASHAGPICNDCNAVTPRLARVAKNALLNSDFPRVIGILDQLAGRAEESSPETAASSPAPSADHSEII